MTLSSHLEYYQCNGGSERRHHVGQLTKGLLSLPKIHIQIIDLFIKNGARGGIQAQEIWVHFQLVMTQMATTQPTRIPTKYFLWIGSVPEHCKLD